MSLRGKTLVPVSVSTSVGSKWDYGFRTIAAVVALGHIDLSTGTPTKPVAFSPRNGKPNRAIKKTAAGTDSSYVDAEFFDEAKTAGYKVTVGRSSAVKGGKRTKFVAVKLSTNVYHGWLMDLETYNYLGAAGRTAMGILDVPGGTVPADELCVNSNGYILTTEYRNIPAGTYITRSALRASLEMPDGKTVKTYIGEGATGVIPAAA